MTSMNTLSRVFVSHRTSSCCTLSESVPATWYTGHSTKFMPGPSVWLKPPHLSTTAASLCWTHSTQAQPDIVESGAAPAPAAVLSCSLVGLGRGVARGAAFVASRPAGRSRRVSSCARPGFARAGRELRMAPARAPHSCRPPGCCPTLFGRVGGVLFRRDDPAGVRCLESSVYHLALRLGHHLCALRDIAFGTAEVICRSHLRVACAFVRCERTKRPSVH